MDIRLVPHREIETIIPLLKTLNPAIPDDVFKQRLSDMLRQGYVCVGAYDEDRLVGCCGLWMLTKHYMGRHIEPDNVVILPEYRGAGIGRKMMQWVHEYGKANGAVASELNCYVTNPAAQKFWMNEGYEIVGFHYHKKL